MPRSPNPARLNLLNNLIQQGSISDEDALVALYDWETWWARDNQLAPTQSQSGGDWAIWLMLAGRGFGKMLALDTPLPTPAGWTTMGDVAVGDALFDEAGKPCRVTAVHPVKQSAEGYRVTFSDGSTIDACAEHLWATWTHAERKAFLRSPYEDTTRFPENWPQWRLRRKLGRQLSETVVARALVLADEGASARSIGRDLGVSRQALASHLRAGSFLARAPVTHEDAPGPQVRSTRDLARTLTYGTRGDLNHCIPQAGALQLPEIDLPLPPYTLGAWLGDGHSNGGTFTAHEDDQPHLIEHLARDGFAAKQGRSDPQRVDVLALRAALRGAGVLNRKHVPAIYLRASAAQRLALLQGLMDTDGGKDNANLVSFTNTNEALTDAVFELVVSLGMKATRDDRIPMCGNTGRPGKRAFRVMFTPTIDVFRLPRKRDSVRFDMAQSLRRHHRMIVAVEPIPPKPMRCITVDSPNALYLAGRSMIPTHNTRTGCEWLRERAAAGITPLAIVGRTAADVRDVLVEGPAGILATSPPWFRPIYQPAVRRLTWPNGVVATTFSAEAPDQMRGPQHAAALADEIAAWPRFEEAWSNLMLGLRLGDAPQVAAMTTPRPLPMIRELLRDPSVAITRGRTLDNAMNLAKRALDYLVARYAGTRLGRQELEGELLDDLPGALWTREMLEAANVAFRAWGSPFSAEQFERIVIGVDPSGTKGKERDDGDPIGLVAAGKLHGVERFVLLEDCTCQERPEEWAARAVSMWRRWGADMIVAEANYGGDMVRAVLAAHEPNVPVHIVHASKGKAQRAEPISALYEQGKVAHAGGVSEMKTAGGVLIPLEAGNPFADRGFAPLEDELAQFTNVGYKGGASPNRADAAVWSLTALAFGAQPEPWIG